MLTYLEIARRLRPQWVVWENVPGVLSSSGGRDFGSFLGALGELGYGWSYRVLDAQWCRTHGHPRAVPQRRRRVFVVGCLGDWERAAQVLFECESVQRDSAPRRKTRKAAPSDAQSGVGTGRITSHDVTPCLKTTCHDYSCADGFTMVSDVSATIAARFGNSRNNHEECVAQPKWPAEVAPTLAQSRNGSGSPGYSDQELFSQGAGNLIPQPVPIQDGREIQKAQNGIGVGDQGDPAYTLDTTGAQAVGQPVRYDLFQITAPVNRQNRKPGDPCHTLARDNAAHAAVAFQGGSQQDQILTPDAVVPTLAHASNSHGGHHQPKVWTIQTPAVAHAIPLDLRNSQRDPEKHDAQNRQGVGVGNVGDPAATVDASFVHGVAQAMTVRRLTPRECERLQGFPDDYTLIPWRKKAAGDCPDGPRYKALGNSMAVNCMAWIGERIAAVDAQMNERNET